MAVDIKYLNRLINCMDPPKDAMIKFPGGVLTERIHGGFMKNTVIQSLFNLERLELADRGRVQGVADKKEDLIRSINGTIKINELEKHQITRLSHSASGSDPRYNGINIAYDAGTGPDKLFLNYRLVVTPATILDPATKLVNERGMIDGLRTDSTLPAAILGELDMSNTIQSISYDTASKSFNIQTSIPGFKNHRIQTRGEGSVFLKGNATKNKYIHDNYENPASLSDIKMFVLVKELGDTLQVLWLKHMIQTAGMDAAMTAILTCDKVLWLRSFVNGVSCVLRDGHSVTYYPVARDEGEKIVAQNTLKRSLLDSLIKHNTEVLTSLRDFLALLRTDDITYTEVEITPAIVPQLNTILISLINFLTPLVADITTRARGMQASDMLAYREFIESHMIVMPFNVNMVKMNVKSYATFKKFLPNVKGESKIVFRPEAIYSGIRRGALDIRNILGDVPLNGAPLLGGSPSRKQKGGTYPYNRENLRNLYEKNSGRAGFLSFFILTYFPELLFIAYSYAVYLEGDSMKFRPLFDYQVGAVISEPFTSMGLDDVYDNLGDPSKNYDSHFDELLSIASKAYRDALTKEGFVSIFDVCYEELKEFLLIQKNTGVVISAEIHNMALGLYDALFNAEVSLNILNRREEMNPIEYFESLQEDKNTEIADSTPPRASELLSLTPSLVRGRSITRDVDEHKFRNTSRSRERRPKTGVRRARSGERRARSGERRARSGVRSRRPYTGGRKTRRKNRR